jgi:hypothetical protein
MTTNTYSAKRRPWTGLQTSRRRKRNHDHHYQQQLFGCGWVYNIILIIALLLCPQPNQPTLVNTVVGVAAAASTQNRKSPSQLWGRRILRVLRGGIRGGQVSPSSSSSIGTDFELRQNATTQEDDSRTSLEEEEEEEVDSASKALFRSLWSRFVPKWESTQFLDRVAVVAASVLQREDSSLEEEDHLAVYNETFLQEITPQSDLSRPGRYFHIVTTAALPWFTGTAVNPLLRAAYLHRRTQEINNANATTIISGTDDPTSPRSWVTLVIPWLELREDQELLYGQVFSTTTEQETYIRNWLRREANMPDVADYLEMIFYPARYHPDLGSIFAMGDMMEQLDPQKMDVAILEEPEHVNCKCKARRTPEQYIEAVIGTN